MSPKLIAITVLGALTTGALLMLFFDVREAPARVSEAKIADARTKHKRVAAPSGPSADPWAPGGRSEGDGRETAPDPAPAAKATAPRLTGAEVPGVPGVVDRAEAPVSNDRGSLSLDQDPRGELMAAREEANRLYDRQDYESAIGVAEKVLSQAPDDIRMLRVVVSSSCQMGDADKARKYWAVLPEHDKNQMTRRCQRFGITFTE